MQTTIVLFAQAEIVARDRYATWRGVGISISTAALIRYGAIAACVIALVLITAILAPAGLAIGCPFPVLLAHHGEPAGRIASLWAINGAASVAGGIVAVLALRVAGSTHALLLAAGSYVVAAAMTPAPERATS